MAIGLETSGTIEDTIEESRGIQGQAEADLDTNNIQEAPSKQLCCPKENCTKSFNRQSRLTEHLRSHSNERPFRCTDHDCNKAFLRDSHLKHHIKSAHTDERNYTCPRQDCQKRFATGTRLRRHESSHETKEKYTCRGYQGCNETFRKHATLSRHVLAVHQNRKPFPCPALNAETQQQCTLGFDTAEKLRSHHRAIHDLSRFFCAACGPTSPHQDGLAEQLSFATYAALQKHITDIHLPTCPHCSLVCTSDRDLRRHLELFHDLVYSPLADSSKLGNFSCTYTNCGRSFSKKGNLNVHVKTVHELRRDFICGQTELKFAPPEFHLTEYENLENAEENDQVEDNNVEERIVTGCGRYFTSKATLEEHVRTIHLGQNSRRQQRNKRKRAERGEPEEVASIDGLTHHSTRRRGPRSAATKSAIAELTGSINATTGAEYELPPYAWDNPFDQFFPQQPDLSDHIYYDQRGPDVSAFTPPTPPPPPQQQQQRREEEEYDDLFFVAATAPAMIDYVGKANEEHLHPQPSFAESSLNCLTAAVLVDPMLTTS